VITHPLLSDLARFGVRLGLKRVRSFLAHLGDPHLAYAVLHVAGTNGKGSVTRMAGAMLRAQGLRVGEATSPHLQHVNERIVVDGSPVTDRELDALLRELDGERRAWAAAAGVDDIDPEAALTYFEMMTIAGLLHFQRAGVDVAVVEVGLGGRLDATNVVSPAGCAIVSIGLDHMAQLGPDLASIAGEKAGIIKPGVPVIVGELPPAAMRPVRMAAFDRGAPLVRAGEEFRLAEDRQGGLHYTGVGLDLEGVAVTLEGAHQARNAAVAIALVRTLPEPLAPRAEAIRAGLATARHPGRMEWLADDLLLDCAHNDAGAVALADHLRGLPEDGRRRTLLLGMSADKDARAVVVSLAPCFDRVLTTHCAHPRAASAGDLAASLVGVDLPVLPAGSVEQALPLARARGDLVVVAGSVFLAGAVRDLLGAR
jgi:dihydrofolate synthase/folylpolyglutamate synthase